MKLSFANDRVLAVMAHPDDAELLCAGTLARAKRDGASIAVCVMCQGDKGVASSVSAENLGEARRGEASAALEMLGAKLIWFGARDGELIDDYPARKKLIQIYREFDPTVIITHSLEDYHPDHRATSAIAEAASWFAGSRGHVTDSPAMNRQPAVWFADTLNLSSFSPEIYIDVSEHLELKKKMLSAHKSQLSRGKDGDFAPLMDVMLRQCEMRGAQAGVGAAEVFRAHHAFKRIASF